ncbi:replication factor C subunit 3-like [Paramacrobiotus metropolitanus]|uniref:replication factor C subunit 3-like n=1 Tax=Paramacrobiotus metropolitanus TaxID=2943436 RepID=UPI00244601FD|nr:replication factor C subunit 3-like [Paramacrobiotus metropolitanus]XP_055334946.1 replication factor C subunit 3-like [Paramacrobiotus metropolitanus]
MSLWVDKYRPTESSKLDYHTNEAASLRNLAASDDFPHLLVFGPPGAGKQTRITCLLADIFGPGVHRMRFHTISVTTPSNKKIDVTTVASAYHIEVNPSDAGIYDRLIVMEALKTIAQFGPPDDGQTRRPFKVVVLMEVDRLTKDAQQALRRTMEKYSATCRLILCCNSISKVIPAIRSRCLNIRVAAPTEDEILRIIQKVCKEEKVNIPNELVKRIVQQSNRNLRRALLTTEATKIKQYPFQSGAAPVLPDWEVYLTKTADLIVKKQDTAQLMEIRGRLYELLVHCIPPTTILSGLAKELIKNCDNVLKCEVIHLAAEYEHRMQLGQKAVYHLEAFVAKFMAVYLRFLDDQMQV